MSEREVVLRHVRRGNLNWIHLCLLCLLNGLLLITALLIRLLLLLITALLIRLLLLLITALLIRLLLLLITALLVLRLRVCLPLSLSAILRSLVVRFPAQKLQIVHRDFRGVSLVACLVSPRPGPQFAFNVNLCAFVDVFLRHISRISPGHDVVPFRVLSKFSIPVTIAFGRREGECRHLRASCIRVVVSIKITYFRVFSNVTDQHYFVQ